MKKISAIVIITLSTFLFFSCTTEESLTPNEDQIPGATGENPFPSDTATTGSGGGGDVVILAPKDEQNRAALLEDFTGVRCTFCPDGHTKAEQAKAELGDDRFIIMAVHGGSYATPSAGWADFTTPFGQALITEAKVSGYPAGTISRFPASVLGATAQNGGSAMSRGEWKSAAQTVNNMPAPLNLGATAVIDDQNVLTVNVDMYFTSSVNDPVHLNVALIQDGLTSKQSGGGDNYIQNNVLRHFLTGQWGEEITETTAKEDVVSKTYTYTVPSDYNGTGVEGGGAVVKSDLKVVVFAAQNRGEVYNVIEIDVVE